MLPPSPLSPINISFNCSFDPLPPLVFNLFSLSPSIFYALGPGPTNRADTLVHWCTIATVYAIPLLVNILLDLCCMHSGISLRAGYVSRLSALARASSAPDAAAAAAAAVVV